MANKTIKDNRKSSLIQWLVFLSRLIVGGTFVFSGFVKAIDPYGTVYKFQDYFSAFHLDFLSSFAMLFFGGSFCHRVCVRSTSAVWILS